MVLSDTNSVCHTVSNRVSLPTTSPACATRQSRTSMAFDSSWTETSPRVSRLRVGSTSQSPTRNGLPSWAMVSIWADTLGSL